MAEHQIPGTDVATLMLFRPEITHFDDEWGPAQRADTLTEILASSSPAPLKSKQSTGRQWGKLSALAACAAAAAVAVGLLLPTGSPGGPDAAAAATLNTLSVIAGHAGGSVAPDEFAYVLEDSEQTMSDGEAQTPLLPGETRVRNLSLGTGETWTAPDGTVWRTVALDGGQSCLAKHEHVLSSGGVFDYADASAPELAQLPTDPGQLANYIDAHPSGDNRGNVNRFTVIGDLLRSGLAPPALRAAALRVGNGLKDVPARRVCRRTLHCATQPGATSGQADLEGPQTAVGDLRRLSAGQSVPRNHEQGFTLEIGEFSERGDHLFALQQSGVGARPMPCGALKACDPVSQVALTSGTPAPIQEGVASDHEQPRQRIIGHSSEAAPRHQEGVRHHLLSRAGVRSSSYERIHAR